MDEIKLRKTDLANRTDVQRANVKNDKNATAKSQVEAKSSKQADTVNIGLSQFIQEALDPAKLETERKDKIEKLKSLIASGEYKPSSEAIASAVSQDITFEILDPETKFSEENI